MGRNNGGAALCGPDVGEFLDLAINTLIKHELNLTGAVEPRVCPQYDPALLRRMGRSLAPGQELEDLDGWEPSALRRGFAYVAKFYRVTVGVAVDLIRKGLATTHRAATKRLAELREVRAKARKELNRAPRKLAARCGLPDE